MQSFIYFVRILAIGIAAFAIAAVIYHGFRNLLPGKKDKRSKKQIRRQARKAAKCMFLTLLVLPAAYAMWRRHQVHTRLAVAAPDGVTATGITAD